MAQKIGVIAEDMSDVNVIKVLAKKILGKSINVDQHVGKGCGPLKRKAPGWCKSLNAKGCEKIIMVHDRDRHDALKLRQDLEEILSGVPQLTKVVVIPEEELEAWLLSDTDAIAKVMKLPSGSKMKVVHHPENVSSPKEYIGKQVYSLSGKKVNYVNSVHNELIAAEVRIDLIENRCPSFLPFKDFFVKKKKSAKP